MKPEFIAKPVAFRKWLEQHHASAIELLVGFYKKGSGRPSITWPESVDEALCFGWIDGVRHSLNEYSYTIRFTPRKPLKRSGAKLTNGRSGSRCLSPRKGTAAATSMWRFAESSARIFVYGVLRKT